MSKTESPIEAAPETGSPVLFRSTYANTIARIDDDGTAWWSLSWSTYNCDFYCHTHVDNLRFNEAVGAFVPVKPLEVRGTHGRIPTGKRIR